MIPVLIIAAGASRRLGVPKQTLEVSPGVSLLSHTISTVIEVGVEDIWVVVGAYKQEVKANTDQHVTWIENSLWESGMGTSISKGVSQIVKERAETKEILILLCDQPYLNPSIIKDLLKEYKSSDKGIVYSLYDNQRSGPPAIFKAKYFDALIELSEDRGARLIIKENIIDTSFISFPKGSYDIDTFDDYQKYLNSRDQKT